jgi:uncharacterized protein (DUF305 family)
MKKTVLMSAASAMALLVAACGSNEEAAQNDAAGTDMNAMMADASNPFAQSEMQMNNKMMAAVGINAADTWVRRMIEHHRGAVEMSRVLLAQNVTGHVADMARQTIDKQTKEIAELEKLVQQGQPDQQSAAAYQPAMTQMHDAMMAAKGTDASDTWVRKMLEHHKGAIAMSDVALANGATGAVRAAAEKVKADQQKEIEHIEGMLAGGAPAAGAEPATPREAAAPAAPAKPAPKAEPKSAPKAAAAKPKAPPAPEPKAPTPTCLPEHRAAGHC